MQPKSFHWELEAGWLDKRVRWSIFIFISACAGLPALAWSVRDLIHHRKNGHRVSAFILLLLLTDIVELLLSPYIMLKQLLEEISWYMDWTCWFFWSLWWSLRVCGFLLNQLVALEGIISVKYPLYTACVFSIPRFIIYYILVFLFIIIGHLFLYEYYLFIVVFVLTMSVITWIIYCRASYSAHRHSHTSRTPDHHILVVFIFNLLVLYLPFIFFNIMFIINPVLCEYLPVWLNPIFLMSVRLISDPLLCVLVCREYLRIQTSLNP